MDRTVQTQPPLVGDSGSALKKQPLPLPLSPSRLGHAGGLASPSRLRSSSPRLHSPASSEIFERNVQEPVPISNLGGSSDDTQQAAAEHIPAHVATEDLIPPALDASTQAITSNNLNPDEVEIVTSALHQPAAAVLEQSTSVPALGSDLPSLNSPAHFQSSSQIGAPLHETESNQSLTAASAFAAPVHADDDSASNYGQLDPTDVRRLSFISFKDIVQSEHQQAVLAGEPGSRESLYFGHAAHERASSPFRSPASTNASLSGGVVTPPPVGAMNPTIMESSPVRGGLPGQLAQHHGELTIETMRQALRKTASGDLGVRSAGLSPVVSNSEDASMTGSFVRESSGLRKDTASS